MSVKEAQKCLSWWLLDPLQNLVTMQWLPNSFKMFMVCLLYLCIVGYLIISFDFVLKFEFLDVFNLPDKIYDMPVTCEKLNGRNPNCYCSLVTFYDCESWHSMYNATYPIGREQLFNFDSESLNPVSLDHRFQYTYHYRNKPVTQFFNSSKEVI